MITPMNELEATRAKLTTVMVELLVDDAQYIESAYRGMNSFAHGRLSEACRKALEKLNDTNP